MKGEQRINSKYPLNAYGRLYIDITFQLREQEGKFHAQGQSKYYNNVRAHKDQMLDDAIYNAIRRATGIKNDERTPYRMLLTPYNITILYYTYTYYVDRYQIISKDGKQYERFRDKENKRTRYAVIKDDKIINPSSREEGIYR